MKKIVSHTLYMLFVLATWNTFSQNENVKGYKIVDDTLIFSFDKRDYQTLTDDVTGEHLKFEDIDIYRVVVSGEFNNWSRDQWEMTKIDDNRYELIKKLEDFNAEFSWQFKFIINNTYWAEPESDIQNIVPAKTPDNHDLYVYNLKIFTAFPSKDGNISFKLKGYKEAQKVILSGTFNRWDEDVFKMNKTAYGWELTLQLRPDEYQYKFIVDGDWVEDPNNPSKVMNEHGNYNSLIYIQTPVTFKLKGYEKAQKVILAASFNDWNEEASQMTKTDYGWQITVLLSGGKHHYKFIVDGEWMVDPDNPVKEYDWDGHINSVCMVK